MITTDLKFPLQRKVCRPSDGRKECCYNNFLSLSQLPKKTVVTESVASLACEQSRAALCMLFLYMMRKYLYSAVVKLWSAKCPKIHMTFYYDNINQLSFLSHFISLSSFIFIYKSSLLSF